MNFKNSYSREEFLSFVKDLIPGIIEDIRPVNLGNGFKAIKYANFLGTSEELDLSIFELKIEGKAEKKIYQAKEGFKLMKEHQTYRALAVYYSEDDQNWRLSLMQMTPEKTETGNITQKFSNPRRYSFYLGPQAKTKTPENFLIKKGVAEDFDDLLSRFSVEVVNKEFYKEIAKFFRRLVGGDIKLGSKLEHFDPEMVLPSVSLENKKIYQEFAVRLIGRIIFCWFLKQKKSAEGISLLPDEFLSKEAVENTSEYYHNVIEKIFFQVLNKPINQRNPELTNGYEKIPYLNGGLFDPHHDDFYENQPNWALKIPDDWFLKLFEILETYNFTIDENTVSDVDLSIDPEMLGRIFENLLAEINPETGESARKSTGSYYTPRPIVEYMVDQSLIQFLLTKTKISEEKIKALVSINELDDEKNPLTQAEKQKVVDALDTIKVIDPACGSGAFPIGILQKIVFILDKTDPHGRSWFQKKFSNIDPLLYDFYRKKFENENFDYIRKTGIIRDSIYGIDIQPIAIEVSKLRCFLTLVVDEEIDDNDPVNRGIQPLPNLEFKFVAANTLIKLPDSSHKKNNSFNLFESDDEISQLKKLREEYFVANGSHKNKVKEEFLQAQTKIALSQINKTGIGSKSLALANWEPFKYTSCEWFDSDWMFGVKAFDIVIGNPPYVEHKKLKYISPLLKKNYLTYSGTADLYVYFYENGIKNLKENGILVYITSNKFLKTSYGENLRKYFTTFKINEIIDFTNVHVFEALVTSCILSISKRNNSNNKVKIAFANDSLLNFADLTGFIEDNEFFLKQSLLSETIWQLENETKLALKGKIESGSVTIGNISTISIYRGITTGYNPAFIIDDEKSKELIKEDEVNKVVIKRLLQGRNIKKWFYESNNENLLFVPWHFPLNKDASTFGASENAEKKLKAGYPSLYKHLLKFKKELADRNKDETGIRYEWYSLQRCAASYYPEFEKEKIIWGLTANKWAFSYDKDKHFLPSNGYILTSQKVSLMYLLALMNSKLMEFYFGFIGIMTAGGAFTLKHETISELPIRIISDSNQNFFVEIVDKILDITKSDSYITDSTKQTEVKEYENQIDQMVYELYDLTPEEIKIIEES